MKKLLYTALAALLPLLALAQPANDYCAGAISIPVNPGTTPTNFVTGDFTGATLSLGVPNQCSGTAYNDLWYHFTAVSNMHLLTISNITQVTALNYEIRSGSCSGNYFYCGSSDPDGELISFFTPGQEYYLRIYSQTSTVPANTTFQLSLTSADPGISVSTTQYTVPELVQEVFGSQTGLDISNITWRTGSTMFATEPNGIGYFERNGTNFPFESGIILSTGNAAAAPGPNVGMQSGGLFAWSGDTDLNTVLSQPSSPNTVTRNATVIEFDFVPYVNYFTLNLIFASEEYGTFQCTFGDGIGIFLTSESNSVTNIGVIPNQTPATPIGVQTIKDGANSNLCPGANTAYFAEYVEPNTLNGATNFTGRTVPFNIGAPVTPGETYHLKIAIADWGDPVYDSALFLEAGSFNITPTFDDALVEADEATIGWCVDELNPDPIFDLSNVTSLLVEDYWSYYPSWFATFEDAQLNINPLPPVYEGMTGDEQTVYVRIKWSGNINVYDIVALHLVTEVLPTPQPVEYVLCDENNDGYTVFNLTLLQTELTGNTEGAVVSFYETSEGVYTGETLIDTPEAYLNSTAVQQEVYVKIESAFGACIAYTTVMLNVLPTPLVEDLAPIAFCPGMATDITVKVDALPGQQYFGTITYHLSEEDAQEGLNPIDSPESYVPQEAQLIWVRIEGPADDTCYVIAEQELWEWYQFMSVGFEGTSAEIIFAEDAEDYEYSFVLNGQPVAPGTTVFEGLAYGNNTIIATNTTCGGSYALTFIISPPAPTGETEQNYAPGQTLSALVVSGEGIQWFAMPTGGTQLPADTQLQDNTTYYAGQFINNATSLQRLGVTAHLVTGIGSNTLKGLKHYPNPATNLLELEYSGTLLSATLYNTLGQEVFKQEIGTPNATLNLSGLANGVYMIKVQAEEGEQLIKIIKS